jgi:geranylgeranyl pyrophosphate synthase
MTPRSAVPPPVTAVLEAGSAWLPRQLGAVETLLGELSRTHGPRLAEDATATLAAGGKRLRPLLVLLCAGPEGGEPAARAGTAIELVHMATLVHDDVLDEAPLRRGRPTVAATSGRDRATATGDLLFAQAFALLSGAGEERGIALLSHASVGLAIGELAQRRDAYDPTISEERYLERCGLKTARLFECACLMGNAASAAPLDEAELRGFGADVGLAFQLLDDVLDVTGPPERTGKARGTDLLDGTVTLPLILAARRDPSLLEADLRALDSAAAGDLCDRVADSGALDEVRARALAMVESAKRRLAGAGFDGERRRLLGLVADGVVERYG